MVQALLNGPELLIVDEPTTGLDPEERIRIRNLLVDFSENRTVLFSTHVVEDLAATCNQLAKYRITSKLDVAGELQLTVISEIQPELECMSVSATLEDAYIYFTNRCNK